jgi:tRNA dimethylallyltransferase
MPKTSNKLIVILGPTASGKTELALRLAKEFNGEIVSADSRQIYREMDIGTAKLPRTKSEKRKAKNNNKKFKTLYYGEVEGIPHYLIDIVDPDKTLTVAQYKKIAIRCIKDIQKRDKTPFLVGGTGLYIQAVVDNLKIPEVPPNKALRAKLEKKSLQELLNVLKSLDPEALETVEKKNKRRIIRAIEVNLAGIKFSQKTKGKPLFDVLQIGISLEKEKLYKKIDQRVDQMIEQGLPHEVENLAEKYSWDLPSMSGIGYQEFKDYFKGKITLDKVIQQIKTHTHQYARRQMSWFKRDKRIHWIKNYSEAKKLIKSFLTT